MRDLRTLSKDLFLNVVSPSMHRALSRWIPGCPSNPNEWQHGRISYSWDGEDLVAERLLRCLGKRAPDVFYVDIGCWHPICHSNSFLFYKQGASGIAVDPNPSVIGRFRQSRSRDTVVQAALSDSSGIAEFCCYEWDETNALKEASATDSGANSFGHAPSAVLTVNTMTLAELFEKYRPEARTIDLLDVDCEGRDLLVLKSNDWSRFQPRVILVEAHGVERQAETQQYLEQFGYQFHALVVATMVFYVA